MNGDRIPKLTFKFICLFVAIGKFQNIQNLSNHIFLKLKSFYQSTTGLTFQPKF